MCSYSVLEAWSPKLSSMLCIITFKDIKNFIYPGQKTEKHYTIQEQGADGEQTESRRRADGEQTESRRRADGEQTESRRRADGEQTESREQSRAEHFTFCLGHYFKNTSYFTLTPISHIQFSAYTLASLVILRHFIWTAVESQSSCTGEVSLTTQLLKTRA